MADLNSNTFEEKQEQAPYGWIYVVLNTRNNKVYVGQTTQGVRHRWKEHVQQACRMRTYFANAIKKHGADAFKVEEIDKAYSKEELDQLEVKYIAQYRSLDSNFGYNTKDGGASGKPTYETRVKFSLAHYYSENKEKWGAKKKADKDAKVPLILEAHQSHVDGESLVSISRRLKTRFTHVREVYQSRGMYVRGFLESKANAGQKKLAKMVSNSDELVAAYVVGESGNSLAKRYGISRDSVSDILKSAGVKIRNVAESRQTRLINENLTVKHVKKTGPQPVDRSWLVQFYPDYENGESLDSIATRNGAYGDRVKTAFLNAGLKVRNLSEAASTWHRRQFGIPKDEQHGTRNCYSEGCRCESCKKANREHFRAKQSAKGIAPKKIVSTDLVLSLYPRYEAGETLESIANYADTCSEVVKSRFLEAGLEVRTLQEEHRLRSQKLRSSIDLAKMYELYQSGKTFEQLCDISGVCWPTLRDEFRKAGFELRHGGRIKVRLKESAQCSLF